jgi:hypothetical protein
MQDEVPQEDEEKEDDKVFNTQLKAGGFKSFRRTEPPTERENG